MNEEVRTVLREHGWPGISAQDLFSLLSWHGVRLEDITDLHQHMSADEINQLLEELATAGEQS
jgi:hypothetical protein